jgi:hypothetical protein
VFVWTSWQLPSSGSQKPKQTLSFENQRWRTQKLLEARLRQGSSEKLTFLSFPPKLHPLPPQSELERQPPSVSSSGKARRQESPNADPLGQLRAPTPGPNHEL